MDRYCINQNDEEEKHSQIRVMDEVYANVVVTVIAAAGSDANSGLPGVRYTSSTSKPSVSVGGRLLVSTLCRPEVQIQDSRWASRGWTYQEAVLSTRRLVFTEEQVYFECRSVNCCESVSKPLAVLHEHGNCDANSQIRKGYFEGLRGSSEVADSWGRWHTGHYPYQNSVEQYTARELTYPSDSLNVFIGIMNKSRTGCFPIYSYLGLPVSSPSRKSHGRSTTVLAATLLWQHKTKLNEKAPRRRPVFPSFTWAGWDGIATLPGKSIYEGSDFETSQISIHGSTELE